MESLIKKIKTKISETEGQWSISLDILTNNRQWHLNENIQHDAASIIKIPIMATIFSLADKGSLSMKEKLALKAGDQVAGSGVLQHLTPGIQISIADLVTLMIIQSDNTATNILIDIAGIKNVQKLMADIGMKNSVFSRKLMIESEKAKGSNLITAKDTSNMLKQLWQGKVTSPKASIQMINIMKNQQIHYLTKKFPVCKDKFIDMEGQWNIASKTGNVTGSKHDVGILTVNGRTMIVSVLSSQCERDMALEGLSQIGMEIFQYLL